MHKSAKPFRILVTGSRECSNNEAAFIRTVLARTCAPWIPAGRPVTIVEGECPYGGVDKVARDWADSIAVVEAEPHPADWDRYGKPAGMIRNSEMVALGADICLAFPRRGSRGTKDCLMKAIDAGIYCQVYPLTGAAGTIL